MEDKLCWYCGKIINIKSGREKFKRYCNSICQWKYHNQKQRKKLGIEGEIYNLNTSPEIRGAISELKVCIDLFERGYEIFRPINPHCSFDLIAYKKDNKDVFKIEVKTIKDLNHNFDGRGYNKWFNICDILALVCFSKICYINSTTKQKIEP